MRAYNSFVVSVIPKVGTGWRGRIARHGANVDARNRRTRWRKRNAPGKRLRITQVRN